MTSPGATAQFVSRGSNRWPAGESVVATTVSGHRDMSMTACPGDAFYPFVHDGLQGAVDARRVRPSVVATAPPVSMSAPATAPPTVLTSVSATPPVGGVTPPPATSPVAGPTSTGLDQEGGGRGRRWGAGAAGALVVAGGAVLAVRMRSARATRPDGPDDED